MGNNEIVRVENTIEKHYSSFVSTPCDRGDNEFEFITYLWNRGCRCIPKAISYDGQKDIGIYSFVKGKLIPQKDVTQEDIDVAFNFLEYVYKATENDLNKFWLAKEFCLIAPDYINIFAKRINKLEEQLTKDDYDKQAKDILERKIKKIFDRETKRYSEKVRNNVNRLRMNIGDFGFHNILKNRKNYTFIDFEYSGIDDVIKQGLYFATGPYHIDVNEDIMKGFEKTFKDKILTEEERKRYDATKPLVNLHFALIQLNFLLPNFMHQSKEFKEGRLEMLNRYLERLK